MNVYLSILLSLHRSCSDHRAHPNGLAPRCDMLRSVPQGHIQYRRAMGIEMGRNSMMMIERE